MIGRDLAKYVRVVDEGAEKIHAVHHGLAGRHAHHGSIVGRMQADQHVGTLHGFEPAQRTREHCGAHFGAATAAAHGNGRDRLRGFISVKLDGAGLRTSRRSHHGRKIGEFAHEVAVDAVLPAPQPGAQQARACAQAPAAARGHGKAVTGADQGQPAALRPVSAQRCILQRQSQVRGQRFALAHRKHTGFFKWPVHHVCNITSGKNPRIADALQMRVDLNKAVCVQRQPGLLQPGGTAGLGDPDDLVHRHRLTVCRLQRFGRDLGDGPAAVQEHLPLGQHSFKAAAHPCAVCGQYVRAAGEQVKAQLVRIAALHAQLAAQSVL